MLFGFPENCSVIPLLNATCTVAVFVPCVPLAVSVYVVVAVGETTVEPTRATSPMPLSIETLSAFETFQLSFDCCPGPTEVGSAENLTMIGGATITFAATELVPPGPVAVAV